MFTHLKLPILRFPVENPYDGKNYFPEKDFKPGKYFDYNFEASRQHCRNSPTEYIQQSRNTPTDKDITILPASNPRRLKLSRPRPSSYHSDRASYNHWSDSFEDYFQCCDDTPPRRRISFYDRCVTPKLDPRKETEIERERNLYSERGDLRLKRDLGDKDPRKVMRREKLGLSCRETMEVMRKEPIRREDMEVTCRDETYRKQMHGEGMCKEVSAFGKLGNGQGIR